MDYLEKAKRVIALEVDELERLSGRLAESFCAAVDACKQAIDTQRKIVVVGVGKSGNIGHKIAATLNSTGATAVVLHSQNALHGDLGLVKPGDVVLAMSQSGETRELLDLLPYLRRFDVRQSSRSSSRFCERWGREDLATARRQRLALA